MKHKYLWISIGAVALIIFLTYTYLGGFRPIEVSAHNEQKYVVAGHYFEGVYDGDSIKSLFYDAKEKLLKAHPNAVLSIVNYQAGIETDTVKSFIGILLPKGQEQIVGYENRIITSKKIIRASIQAHSLVMPARTTINKKVADFAEENGLTLVPLEIEKYISDNELVIDRLTTDLKK